MEDVASKRFSTYLTTVGAKESTEDANITAYDAKPRYSFHSFRNNFADATIAHDISREIKCRIAGWSIDDGVDRRYGLGISIEKLYKEYCRMGYEYMGVDFSQA